VAFKVSNGFLAIALPLLWIYPAASLPRKLQWAVLGSVSLLAAFALFYGFWGWQLWVHFGNPVYPLYDDWFAPMRHALGWRR